MRTIGIDLAPWIAKGLLHIEASRPKLHGLETHLAQIHQKVSEFQPQSVIIDPMSNLNGAGSTLDAEAMLLRLIDFLKSKGITAMFVNLTSGGRTLEATDVGISSLIDTWIVLRDIELGGERNRGLYVIKSRGMKHSNQIREFLITSRGIELEDVYVGPEGVLTGSLRVSQEAREKAAAIARQQDLTRQQRAIEHRRATLQAQILALQHEFTTVEEESATVAAQALAEQRGSDEARQALAKRRGSDRREA